jgi:putative spermidine/putrescine transport system substrate-binding protein
MDRDLIPGTPDLSCGTWRVFAMQLSRTFKLWRSGHAENRISWTVGPREPDMEVFMRAIKQTRVARRSFLRLTASALAAGVAPAVISAAARAQSKTFVIYSFDGVLGKTFKDLIIPPFEKQHGVKIETITMPGSVPPMQKVKAMVDAGRPEADVIPMQLTDYVYAKRNNLVMPIGRDEIPEYKNLHPQFITDHGPGLLLWSYGIAYNTKHIKQEPTSWKELWNPAYKGKVAVNEPNFDHTLQMVNLTFTGKPLPITDETFKNLTALRPNLLTLYTTGAQLEQVLRQEEIWIGAAWNSRTAAVQDEGIPVKFVAPKEGFFVRYNPFCIARGARDPALAKVWINYVCGKEAQSILAEKGYQGSPNKEVVYSEHIKQRLIVTDPNVFKLAVKEDFETIVDNIPEWRRRWDAWKQS